MQFMHITIVNIGAKVKVDGGRVQYYGCDGNKPRLKVTGCRDYGRSLLAKSSYNQPDQICLDFVVVAIVEKEHRNA